MYKLRLSFAAICILGLLSFSTNGWANRIATTNGTSSVIPGEEESVLKTGKKKKKNTKAARSNKVVKIYPDIIKREMHVVAKNSDGKTVDFFVFDMAGTIVQQYKMNEKDHKRITGLQPGTYIYRVFTGDTESDFGTFEIK